MKKILLASGIFSLFLVSCGSESTSTETTTETTSDSTLFTPAPDTNTNALPPAVMNDTTRTSSIQAPPVVLPVAAANKTAGNVALNPEHGQPGHRCDIAVGAPLNGQASAGTPANQPVVTTTPSAAAPSNNSGTVRLNPAHGQPGHDCAVEVGKPLKN